MSLRAEVDWRKGPSMRSGACAACGAAIYDPEDAHSPFDCIRHLRSLIGDSP